MQDRLGVCHVFAVLCMVLVPHTAYSHAVVGSGSLGGMKLFAVVLVVRLRTEILMQLYTDYVTDLEYLHVYFMYDSLRLTAPVKVTTFTFIEQDDKT